MIGDHIHLMVVSVQGGKVRLGISAPKEVVVDRQEIHERCTNTPDKWVGPAICQTLP